MDCECLLYVYPILTDIQDWLGWEGAGLGFVLEHRSPFALSNVPFLSSNMLSVQQVSLLLGQITFNRSLIKIKNCYFAFVTPSAGVTRFLSLNVPLAHSVEFSRTPSIHSVFWGELYWNYSFCGTYKDYSRKFHLVKLGISQMTRSRGTFFVSGIILPRHT